MENCSAYVSSSQAFRFLTFFPIPLTQGPCQRPCPLPWQQQFVTTTWQYFLAISLIVYEFR